jgi:hypothetical protein
MEPMAGEASIMRASAVWSWAAGATMTTSPSAVLFHVQTSHP